MFLMERLLKKNYLAKVFGSAKKTGQTPFQTSPAILKPPLTILDFAVIAALQVVNKAGISISS